MVVVLHLITYSLPFTYKPPVVSGRPTDPKLHVTWGRYKNGARDWLVFLGWGNLGCLRSALSDSQPLHAPFRTAGVQLIKHGGHQTEEALRPWCPR